MNMSYNEEEDQEWQPPRGYNPGLMTHTGKVTTNPQFRSEKITGATMSNSVDIKSLVRRVKQNSNTNPMMMTGYNKNRFMDIKKNQIKATINQHTINDRSAWERMKAYDKKSRDWLFKDSDGDGVPNVFDCQPYNKKKQALIHDLLKFGEAQSQKRMYDNANPEEIKEIQEAASKRTYAEWKKRKIKEEQERQRRLLEKKMAPKQTMIQQARGMLSALGSELNAVPINTQIQSSKQKVKQTQQPKKPFNVNSLIWGNQDNKQTNPLKYSLKGKI